MYSIVRKNIKCVMVCIALVQQISGIFPKASPSTVAQAKSIRKNGSDRRNYLPLGRELWTFNHKKVSREYIEQRQQEFTTASINRWRDGIHAGSLFTLSIMAGGYVWLNGGTTKDSNALLACAVSAGILTVGGFSRVGGVMKETRRRAQAAGSYGRIFLLGEVENKQRVDGEGLYPQPSVENSSAPQQAFLAFQAIQFMGNELQKSAKWEERERGTPGVGVFTPSFHGFRMDGTLTELRAQMPGQSCSLPEEVEECLAVSRWVTDSDRRAMFNMQGEFLPVPMVNRKESVVIASRNDVAYTQGFVDPTGKHAGLADLLNKKFKQEPLQVASAWDNCKYGLEETVFGSLYHFVKNGTHVSGDASIWALFGS